MGITAHLHRYKQNDKESFGTICLKTENGDILFTCLSLELGWKGNQRNISCVPIGEYKMVLEFSPKFERFLWELKGVPNRSECKIHPANSVSQLQGCIALGLRRYDNQERILDSQYAVSNFHHVLNNANCKCITLIITGEECIK